MSLGSILRLHDDLNMYLADRRGRSSVHYLQQSPVSPGECSHSTQTTTNPQSNRELTALLSTCVSGRMCNRTLLPTDGSDGTERAVEHAIDHGTTYDTALHVLTWSNWSCFAHPLPKRRCTTDSRRSDPEAISNDHRTGERCWCLHNRGIRLQ